MIFPITDLLDDNQSQKWILEHFHPEGLRCPKCNSTRRRFFRKTQTSQLSVYRCLECEGIYNLYSGTLFEKKHLRPSQVVLLLRGVSKGESSKRLAKELSLSRTTVHQLRKELQANAQRLQSQMSPLWMSTLRLTRCSRMRGKKVRGITTLKILQENALISAVGTAPTTTTTGRQS